MRSKIILALAALLAAFSGPLHALGLGDASVRSFLNEPLDVRIELIGVTERQLEDLEAALASADDFELVGLSRAQLTVPLDFEVITGAGEPYVSVRSRLPIAQPVLQMLVEVSWSGGRMLRQYTLFLDPPTVAAPPPPRPVPQAQAEAAAATPAAAPARSEAAPASTPAPTPRPAPGGALEHGPVQDGETLWGIARDWSRGSGYTVNQMMLAIQRENPDAFIRENINLLKRGSILRLPTRERAGELSVAEARLEVARQNEGAGLLPLPTLEDTLPAVAQGGGAADGAGAAADAGPGSAEAEEAEAAPDSATVDAGEDAERVADASAVPETTEEQAGGRLELVPPSEEELAEAAGQAESPGAASSPEELARVEEELASTQQANEYLSERVRELEQQLEQTRGELSVADRELAQVEASLREQRAAADDTRAALPWWLWLVGGAVLVAAGGGFLAWRRGRGDDDEVVMVDHEAPTRVQGLREEAEELLDVLGEDAAGGASGGPDAPPDEAAGSEATVRMHAVPDPEPAPRGDDDDATVVVPHPALAARRGDEGRADDDDDYDVLDVDEPWARESEDTVVTDVAPDDETAEPGAEEDDERPAFPGAPDEDLGDEFADDLEVGVEDDFEDDDTESGSGDAVELDAADPEIKLDLARAYLSLGDREAARAMLEEVLSVGSDEQKAEAAAMMDEL